MLVEVTGHPLEWMGLNAMLVTAVDVTERQAANASLRRQNVMLQSKLDLLASDLKKVQDEHNSFNYALSHDLQSPLHVVDGFAKTLVARYSESLDAQGLHFLQRIEASVQKMAKLIDDLRLLSRIPRLAMNVQSVDLAPICTVIMERLRKDDPGRVTELEMPDRVEVWGDKTLLATALGCLLENAWKFTARKPQAWIKIGLTHTPGSNDDVLSVLDNGAGFDSAYTHKLFVPFQRLHSSADFPGTGLGLAIVKKIAERHGGTVSAESADSAGANVFMRMPRMDAATTSLSVR